MIELTRPTTNFPAMQGVVGTRLVTYSTQLPAEAIEGFLGHDPRSRHWRKLPGDVEAIYKHVQRVTKDSRLTALADYIETRCSPDAPVLGAFPAVSIAVQRHINFRPIDADKHPGVGNIEVDMSARNARIVVDGLGRLSAVLEILERTYDNDLDKAEQMRLSNLLSNFSVPVIIYAPHPDASELSRDEMGQLFFDFNFKVARVSDAHAIALDKSDPYIVATNQLAFESKAISQNGGMELRSASLGKKSTALVVQQVLLRFVRGSMEGNAFQESNKAMVPKNPNLTLRNLRDRVEALADFVDAFASAMGEKFTKDRKSLHLSAPGWQALGIIYNDLVFRLSVPDVNRAAVALGRIDWSRSSELWKELVMEKIGPDGQELVLRTAGASAKREIVAILRREVGIHSLMRNEEVEAEAA
jgi:DGQHR domain-containing protein